MCCLGFIYTSLIWSSTFSTRQCTTTCSQSYFRLVWTKQRQYVVLIAKIFLFSPVEHVRIVMGRRLQNLSQSHRIVAFHDALQFHHLIKLMTGRFNEFIQHLGGFTYYFLIRSLKFDSGLFFNGLLVLSNKHACQSLFKQNN